MPVGTSEQINAYEEVPARLVAALEDLNEGQMHFVPAIGEWSIHEIVIHLADSEVIGHMRVRKTIAEPGSTLPIYDEEAWAGKLSYRLQDQRLAIELFRALRASTAALLRALPEETWQRLSLHPERGEMSFYDVFVLYLEHGEIHLQQIERIKQVLASR
jgi:DinB superfamily